jgi:hypothetical protein
MAIHKFYDPLSVDPTNSDPNNFGASFTITAASTASDQFIFDANRPFTVIIDATVGFAGTVYLQMKIGSGNWFPAYAFTSSTQVKQVVGSTLNTQWQMMTSADFSGSVTCHLYQSKVANYSLG